MSVLGRGVDAVMTRRVIRVGPDEPVDIAFALMISCTIRHLPVDSHGRLVGIVTLRDLLPVIEELVAAAGTGEVRALRARPISAFMRSPVVTADPAATIGQVAARMLEQHVSSVAVLRGEEIAGIVTREDFVEPARALLEEDEARGNVRTVADLMGGRELAAVEPGENLGVAFRTMCQTKVRHLPVTTRGRWVGMLSDLDVLRSVEAVTTDGALLTVDSLRVGRALPDRVVSVAPTDLAIEAARVMTRRRPDALPVLDRGKIVGVLTTADYFYYCAGFEPSLREAESPP